MSCLCPAFVHQSNASAQTSFMNNILAKKSILRLGSFVLKVFCVQKFQQSTVQIAETCDETRSWDIFEEREKARLHSLLKNEALCLF